MWPYVEDGGTYIFGNMKFSVERPTGTCVRDGAFCSGNLRGFPKGYVDLNLAMAGWFNRNSWIDVPFDDLEIDAKPVPRKIYFLGTVWWDLTTKRYIAPALVSSAKGVKIQLKIEFIPDGEWPKNCYVALLVP